MVSDAGTERLVLRCVDLLAELLAQPLDRFPVQEVAEHLRESVGASMVAWNYVSGHRRRLGYLSEGAESFRDAGEAWLQAHGPGAHPLLRWYATSGSTVPLTAARVPNAIADRRCQEAFAAVVEPLGVLRQLSVPVSLSVHEHDAVVLGRDDVDFSDADVELVARIQPLLVGVRRQIETRRRWADSHGRVDGEDGSGADDAARAVGLTPRELCVLQLLSEGWTQHAMAHHLGISPRTVHKHVEHVYAKLGVGDRLLAVMRARDLSVLPQQRER
ncbi:helix-turn-helix transcriptional regulator [Aquipuribacter nitratireducens]|uniref:Response regulator transcription factor n=1 Tax=Aquipuribacter nitratireducens TaxID=650104 RepID=A0ABW0GLL9_9MICO